MKTSHWTAMVGISALLAAGSARAAEPVIASLDSNGRLVWTNAVNTAAIERVEWAARANGPWHAFTYQPLFTVDAHARTQFVAEVPMFYRVVMATNEPPQDMVWIDGGDFTMGDTEGLGYGSELPVHTNFISGFWMDVGEVTQAKWNEVRDWAVTHGYDFGNPGSGKGSNHPVHTVNWYDCVKWCNARSEKEDLPPMYYTTALLSTVYRTGEVDVVNGAVAWQANGYRLPTEAEWEKGARGGRQDRLFPWGGDTIQHARANYNADTNAYFFDTSPTQGLHPEYSTGMQPHTSPVGSFSANGYGLHDMAGNVLEWCWDWYAGAYPIPAAYRTDPVGAANATMRVSRGGSYVHDALFACCFVQNPLFPIDSFDSVGFRCVCRP